MTIRTSFKARRGRTSYVFSGVHAIQTSTPAMAAVLRDRNPEIRVFPERDSHAAGRPQLRRSRNQ